MILFFGFGVAIPFHRFIDGPVDKGRGAFPHAFRMILNDGSLLRGNADLDFNKTVVVLLICPSPGFGKAFICSRLLL